MTTLQDGDTATTATTDIDIDVAAVEEFALELVGTLTGRLLAERGSGRCRCTTPRATRSTRSS